MVDGGTVARAALRDIWSAAGGDLPRGRVAPGAIPRHR